MEFNICFIIMSEFEFLACFDCGDQKHPSKSQSIVSRRKRCLTVLSSLPPASQSRYELSHVKPFLQEHSDAQTVITFQNNGAIPCRRTLPRITFCLQNPARPPPDVPTASHFQILPSKNHVELNTPPRKENFLPYSSKSMQVGTIINLLKEEQTPTPKVRFPNGNIHKISPTVRVCETQLTLSNDSFVDHLQAQTLKQTPKPSFNPSTQANSDHQQHTYSNVSIDHGKHICTFFDMESTSKMPIQRFELIKIGVHLSVDKQKVALICQDRSTKALFILGKSAKKGISSSEMIPSLPKSTGLVECYYTCRDEKSIYSILQYYDRTLESELLYRRIIPLAQARSYFSCILKTVSSLHSQGIAHGELCLSNVVLLAQTCKILKPKELTHSFKSDIASIVQIGFEMVFGREEGSGRRMREILSNSKGDYEEYSKMLLFLLEGGGQRDSHQFLEQCADFFLMGQ